MKSVRQCGSFCPLSIGKKSAKLDMVRHVLCHETSVDQSKILDELPDAATALVPIDNASVIDAGLCQCQEVRIVGHHNASRLAGKFEVSKIGGGAEADFDS